MFCSGCGSKKEGRFCSNCGAGAGGWAQNQVMASNAPGKNYLMVSGILLIIAGVFSAISAISGLALTEGFVWLTGIGGVGAWRVYYTWAMLAGFYAVIMGIVGIINREDEYRTTTLAVLAIISIVSVVLIYIFAAVARLWGGLSTMVWVTLPFDLILPILYLAGALKNDAAMSAGKGSLRNLKEATRTCEKCERNYPSRMSSCGFCGFRPTK